jgi:16S rRNA (uracil1498-N3)-methyltransferase
LDRSKRVKRRERWEKIAIEASKQCGRAVIPRVAPIQNYAEMLEAVPSESLRIILWEREGAGLKEVLQGSKGKKRIFFIVGPEGGLSQEEVEQAKGKGCIPVLLGKRILRSETASLCLLSILQYELGDVG